MLKQRLEDYTESETSSNNNDDVMDPTEFI